MTRRSIHYEDLELGAVWTTRGRTLVEADIAAYSGLAGDFHPLHADAKAAAAGRFGGRVAPAGLLIAVAIGLGTMDVPISDSGILVGTSWRFSKAVRPGATLTARWRLQRKRDVEDPRSGLAGWQVALLDEAQEPVAEGDVTLLVARREAVAAGAPARSRRRRRRKPEPSLPSPEANLPPSGDAIPEPAPEDVPPAPARARRRRRRRPSNGEQPKPAEPEPAPASAPLLQSAAAKEPNAVEKVLGRLTGRRRSPTPAAPASPGTR